jgi:hypothetical protein
MAARRVYGLIPSEDEPTEKHCESAIKGRSKCGRRIDTTLPIPKDLTVCQRCTRFDLARPFSAHGSSARTVTRLKLTHYPRAGLAVGSPLWDFTTPSSLEEA